MADADVDAPSHPDSEVSVAGAEPGKPEKPISLSGRHTSQFPPELQKLIAKVDEILLRLSKLFKTTAGLGASLSTLNYTLYIATYLHAQSPSRAKLIAYISRFLGGTVPAKIEAAALKAASLPPSPSFLGPLGKLISETRTTLRLIGLIPLTIWLKSLLTKKITPETDLVAHRIALVQCMGYIVFQACENVFHLAAQQVIPPQKLASTGGIPQWVLVSCRGWLVGLLMDLLRLWREAVKTEDAGLAKSVEEKAKADEKWRSELFTTVCWLPVAVQYSVVGGIPGWNQGIMGVCGALAGLNNTRKAWAATKE